jgi:hypothetical protein
MANLPPFDDVLVKQPRKPRLSAIHLSDIGGGAWSKGFFEDLGAWRKKFGTDNLQEALARYDGIHAEFEIAAKLPHCRFPLRYGDLDVGGTAHLEHIRELAKLCRLHALIELDAGNTKGAINEVALMMRLSDSIDREPFFLSLLAQFSIQSQGLQPVWEGLARGQWSEAELVELQARYESRDVVERLLRAAQGDRLWSHDVAKVFLSHRASRAITSSSTDRLIVCSLPKGWGYHGILLADKMFTEHFFVSIDPDNHRIHRSDTYAVVLESSFFPYRLIPNIVTPQMGTPSRLAAKSQSESDHAALACALERYWMKHGNYPDQLSALVPEFIAKLPTDVLTGEPYHYTKTDNGRFKLWSVGWNQTDEGGVVDSKNSNQGDWVWQYPAESKR